MNMDRVCQVFLHIAKKFSLIFKDKAPIMPR